MAWEKYTPGFDGTRKVFVSKELYKAIEKCAKDKSCYVQQVFDYAVYSLWRIWNGNTTSIEAKDKLTEMEVRNYISGSAMPRLSKKLEKKIHIQIRGDRIFEWLELLEGIQIIRNTRDGIRRIITWYLKEQKYL